MIYQDRLLINSLPKSGTHLLAKAVELFGYREHFHQDGPKDSSKDSPKDSPKGGQTPVEICSPVAAPIFLNRRETLKALKTLPAEFLAELSAEQMAVVQNPDAPLTDRTGIVIGSLTDLQVLPIILKRWLKGIAPGQYILGHLPQTTHLEPVLEEIGCRHVFIIRDPRAVIVSSLPFFLNTGNMPAQHFLKEDMETMALPERLSFLLHGGYAPKAGVQIKGFATVYRSMLAWRGQPGCLFLRFEDLVGVEGGGSQERQRTAIESIAQHLGQPIDAHVEAKIRSIYDSKARTFRKGKVDAWKTALDPDLVQQLSQYCHPLCQEANYLP